MSNSKKMAVIRGGQYVLSLLWMPAAAVVREVRARFLPPRRGCIATAQLDWPVDARLEAAAAKLDGPVAAQLDATAAQLDGAAKYPCMQSALSGAGALCGHPPARWTPLIQEWVANWVLSERPDATKSTYWQSEQESLFPGDGDARLMMQETAPWMTFKAQEDRCTASLATTPPALEPLPLETGGTKCP
jgi:hypothetical protein